MQRPGVLPAEARYEGPSMSLCPFCGVVTETPHESQQGCLTALAAEIARLRAVVDHVQSARVPSPALHLHEDDEPNDPATGD